MASSAYMSCHGNSRDINNYMRNTFDKNVADYPSMLSLKFGDDSTYQQDFMDANDSYKPVTEEDGEDTFSDNSVDERLKPGVRDKQTAASLRIFQIEKKLFKKKDLSKKQRRALQARKNTAIFRERKRQAMAYRHLFEVELDLIHNKVSRIPPHFEKSLGFTGDHSESTAWHPDGLDIDF